MRGLRVEPEAEAELAAAIDWYEAEQPGLGAALVTEIDDVIADLRRGDLPGLGVPGLRADLTVRRVLLDRFPYAVVFLDHADELHVLAFAHHKRRPGYWKARMPPR